MFKALNPARNKYENGDQYIGGMRARVTMVDCLITGNEPVVRQPVPLVTSKQAQDVPFVATRTRVAGTRNGLQIVGGIFAMALMAGLTVPPMSAAR